MTQGVNNREIFDEIIRDYLDKERHQLKKKRFLSAIARMMEGEVYPCPNFLALFEEVQFWLIKRAYFFKNANVLNF